MHVGMFQTPFLRPERSAAQVFDWALRQAVVADEAGFSEYWVGEHATLDWESIPSPELVIAAAARVTKTIKLGPLAHLLPYYHPATLAIQSAWMSQVLEGRYMMGVATGAYPTDAALRGIKDMAGNHQMMLESIEIMEKVWKAKPFEFQGDYWAAGYPAPVAGHPFRDTRPYGGKMQMAMTGLSAPSPSIKFAASRGYLPASVYAGNNFLRSHFDDYAEVAAANGHPVGRHLHRVVRDVVVADSDAEAKRLAIKGLGLAWETYLKPTYERFGVLKGLLHDPEFDQSKVDAEYLADHVWIVGSPETVAEKFEQWFDDLGGPFGTVLIYSHDYIDDPAPWEESMRRLAQEVAPKLAN
jgi:alkanesulfonate monooxygenase SsuD/methylene tetrahydromethanopterin reductase-like flavin-dependent oxidoreductase (luciferase family)